MSKNTKKTGGMPEFIRKFIVSLKRKPQTIALVVLMIAFLVYSLNLTHISHTTSRIQGPNMGLYGFITMLFSMLSFVCFLNAFPRRKKINIPMLALMFVMLAAVIFCDVQYRGLIMAAITRAENPIAVETYIAKAYNMLLYHIVILVIGMALTALVPVYGKLLRKIKTSVDVEDNGELGKIELSD